jgi:putative transposase
LRWTPLPASKAASLPNTGGARFAYNWGLELVTTRLYQQKKGEGVRVPWTLPELRREWNRAKDDVAPWWRENSKEAYNSGLDALARALKNWNDSRHGRRKGRPVGFPRRKTKRRARVACRFTTGQIKLLPDRKHVQLPRIGVLKTHESTRKLARRLEQGTARILAATISRRADRWFVSFTVEVQRAIPTSNRKPGSVGVDVGVHNLAVLSTGTKIANPRALDHLLRGLRRLNRQLARRNAGSRRRRQTWRRLVRVHARAANIRRDALHKLTTSLATQHGTVVVEQLNVAGMVRNRRLARAISDTGMAELRRLLGYKTSWYGCRLGDLFPLRTAGAAAEPSAPGWLGALDWRTGAFEGLRWTLADGAEPAAGPAAWEAGPWLATRWTTGEAGSWAAQQWLSRSWAARSWAASGLDPAGWAALQWGWGAVASVLAGGAQTLLGWVSRQWAGLDTRARSWVARHWAELVWVARSWAARSWAGADWIARSWAARSWGARSWGLAVS